MNCPVCNRNLASSLSICPSCGTMVHDSVREELKPKISPVAKPQTFEKKGKLPLTNNMTMQNKPKMPISAPPKRNIIAKPKTQQIAANPTRPTLVEFHNKNATLPEWRLQLQNAVRQRQSKNQTESEIKGLTPVGRLELPDTRVNDSKTEPVRGEIDVNQHENPVLAKALQRIANSRDKFLVEEQPEEIPAVIPMTSSKNYSYQTDSTPPTPAVRNTEMKAAVNFPQFPKLPTPPRNETGNFDTNKLPPLPVRAKISSSFHKLETPEKETEIEEKKVVVLNSADAEEILETEEFEEIEIEEIEDCAPIAMRFNAGLFDVIIGAFVSLLLLAPFMLLGGNWFSIAGFIAFIATCALVMFIYLTTAIGLFGKTFGMRLFSLEVVDIEGEDYPSLHQAAVSSSVYLLSLVFGGIGFLTLPFSEEKRAVHDLVSGTIVVKEF